MITSSWGSKEVFLYYVSHCVVPLRKKTVIIHITDISVSEMAWRIRKKVSFPKTTFQCATITLRIALKKIIDNNCFSFLGLCDCYLSAFLPVFEYICKPISSLEYAGSGSSYDQKWNLLSTTCLLASLYVSYWLFSTTGVVYVTSLQLFLSGR